MPKEFLTDVDLKAGLLFNGVAVTAAGKALLDDADAAAQRTTLGLGTLATQSGTFSGTSSGTNTGDQTITLTGDVTGSGTGSFTTAIAAGVIVNADVNASAAIAGTKINPNFGSQNVVTTGNLQGASINGGPLAGFRNAIINGNFDIWQRGTADFGQGYWADRWNAYLVAGASMLQSRYTLTDAQRNVIGYEAVYAWQVYTSDTTSSVQVQQPIEDVRTFAGQQVAVSFWAFTDTGTCTISSLMAQFFGTGGSPSATVETSLTLSATAITTTPTKITAVVTLPSIAGKTLGTTAGTTSVSLVIRKVAGAANRLRIAQVQVERGPVATPFERRPIGAELALCQRYYCKTFNTNTAPANNVGLLGALFTTTYAVGGGGATWKFPVEMRGQPTLSTYNPSANNGNWRDVTNGADRTIGVSTSTGTTQTDLLATTSAAGAAYIYIHAAASAEL